MSWESKNEFVIREGGAALAESMLGPRRGFPYYGNQYWHIGYPTVTQLKDGTIVTAFHEYSDDKSPIQCLRCTRFTL
jgi:hypothetical protein